MRRIVFEDGSKIELLLDPAPAHTGVVVKLKVFACDTCGGAGRIARIRSSS